MKTVILYNSMHHKNTEKIAVSLANSLKADIFQVSQANADIITQYDLIGFGSGIFYRKHHKSLFSFIETLPAAKGKKAFVFSTSGTGKADFNEPLQLTLENKGFLVLGAFACPGYDTWGPYKVVGGINKGKPDDVDIKNATDFVQNLVKSIR
jgi:flavodoxin